MKIFRGFAIGLIMAAGGMAAKAETGVFPDRIVVGRIADLSGPTKAKVVASEIGIRAAFKEVNDTGGIYGRMLDLKTADDKYDAKVAEKVAREFFQTEAPFALILMNGTPPSHALLPLSSEYKIPILGSTSGTVMREGGKDEISRYFFNIRSGNYDDAKSIVDLVAGFGGKLSLVAQDNRYGKDGLAQTQRATKEDGLALSSVSMLKVDLSNMKEVLDEVIASKADNVLLFLLDEPAAKFITELKKIKGNTLRYMCVTTCGSFANLMDTESLNGVIVVRAAPSFTLSTPRLIFEENKALAAVSHPELKDDGSAYMGYLSARIFIQGLKDAGPKPTRENFVDALEKFRARDFGDVFVDYSNKYHSGVPTTELIIYDKNGKVIR